MPFPDGPRPDEHTSTREEWTQYHLRQQCPSNAAAKYRKLFTDLQHLFDLLAHHEAMRPNIQQTFMTPAASKNKVYFVWDFIGRSLGMMYAINPKLPRSANAVWEEVYGRTMFGMVLINDTSGKLDAMNQSVGHNDDAGIDFGDEIKNFANTVG